MQAAAERDSKVRIGATSTCWPLFVVSARGYLLQSSGFWYAPGAGLADESAPFAVDASPGVAARARTYAELEATALRGADIECVVLRYGFFYGPGTWYTKEGDLGEH